MDFKLNINGLNNNKYQEKPGNSKKREAKKQPESDVNTIEDNVKNGNNKFKQDLNNLQDFITSAQDKINILEMASETLDDISTNLDYMRNRALETIDSLESYGINEKLKKSLENINKLEEIHKKVYLVQDESDKDYTQIIEEFKKITNTTIKLAKTQGFESDLNNNPRVDSILQDLNETMSSITLTKSNLEEIKNSLINNIKNLNITLENMVSSYSKIRSIEAASQAIKLTQTQILHEAMKSISIQLPSSDITVDSLVS